MSATTIELPTLPHSDTSTEPAITMDGNTLGAIVRSSIPHIERRVRVLATLYKTASRVDLTDAGTDARIFAHLAEWMPRELDTLKREAESLPPASPLVLRMNILRGLYEQHTILERDGWSNALGPYVAMLTRELATKGYHELDDGMPQSHHEEPYQREDPSYRETVAMHVFHNLACLIMVDPDASILVPLLRCYTLQLLCICPPTQYSTIVNTLPAPASLVMSDLGCRIPALRWILDLHDTNRLLVADLIPELMVLSLRDKGEGMSDLSMLQMLTDQLVDWPDLLKGYHASPQGPKHLLREVLVRYENNKGNPNLPPLATVVGDIIEMLPLSLAQMRAMLPEFVYYPEIACLVLDHIYYNLKNSLIMLHPKADHETLANDLIAFRTKCVEAGTLKGVVLEFLTKCVRQLPEQWREEHTKAVTALLAV